MLFFKLGVFFFHNGILRNLPAKLITFDARNTIESSIWLCLAFENVSSWMITVFVRNWSDDRILLKCRQRWMLAVLPEYGRQTLQHNTRPISAKVLMEPSSRTTDLAGCSSSKQSANTCKSFWLNDGEYQRAGTLGHHPRPGSLWTTVWKRSKQILQGLP